MADIRTLDYAAEYEFKETYGIRFHETKLKLASSESVQQNATVGESDDRIIRRDDRGDEMIVMGEDYRPQPFSSSSSYEKFGVRDYHYVHVTDDEKKKEIKKLEDYAIKMA